MAMKYPKAFNNWYSLHIRVQCLREFQMHEYKTVLFNAWKAGRKHQKQCKPIGVHNTNWV